MAMIGFAKDVLRIKSSGKRMLLSVVASLPFLMVYYTHIRNTTVVLPRILYGELGMFLHLGK